MKKLFNPILFVCLAYVFSNPITFAQEKASEKTETKKEEATDSEATGSKKKEAKPYISIAKPNIKNVSDLQKRLIIRSAIGVVMKSGKYNMLFSSPKSFEDAKFKFYKLEMEGSKTKWGKNKAGYNLKFRLVDAYTKEVLRETIKTRIEERHLVFKAKLLQWELIFGKDKAKELEKEIEAQTEDELKEEEVKDPKEKDDKANNENKGADAQTPPPAVVDEASDLLAEAGDKKEKKKAEEEEFEEKSKKEKKKKEIKIS
ncbi:MAG: hypothetical protein EP326_06250, partial [Deltaproteobacteria bacterium]